jgi:hypothetical protein
MRQKSSDEQLGVDAKAVTDLIARNARVAQNQKEYNERYDALVSRYEDTERKRDALVGQIDQIMIRRRKFERFIESVKALPELITEFDESLWAALDQRHYNAFSNRNSCFDLKRRSSGMSELWSPRRSE